jgi:hypothetical protein
MIENKQKTAVEWYIEKLLDLDYEYAKGLITLAVWSERKKSLIEQAKEMEKEQIAKAFDDGDYNYYCSIQTGNDLDDGQEHYQEFNDGQDYYEKTYGHDKQ